MPESKVDTNTIKYNKYKIHVTDDSTLAVTLINDMLTTKGYQVTSTTNGKDAINAIKSDKPDLIILDVEMPVMDGYETIKILKMDKHTSSIPVIFSTGLTKAEVITKLFELGASDYISKPFVPEELLARVEKEIKSIMLQNMLKEKISKLAELISTDELTRTSNKMHMTSIIKSKLQKLKLQNRGSFSLMYIDVDNFNSYAKIHGITSSENALKKIAMMLKRSIRDKDILSRWQGDIFMIFFPQIIKQDIDNISKKIRDSIQKLPFESNTILTCSISMIEIQTVDTLENILNNLKARIKEAKNNHTGSIVTTDGKLLR